MISKHWNVLLHLPLCILFCFKGMLFTKKKKKENKKSLLDLTLSLHLSFSAQWSIFTCCSDFFVVFWSPSTAFLIITVQCVTASPLEDHANRLEPLLHPGPHVPVDPPPFLTVVALCICQHSLCAVLSVGLGWVP